MFLSMCTMKRERGEDRERGLQAHERSYRERRRAVHQINGDRKAEKWGKVRPNSSKQSKWKRYQDQNHCSIKNVYTKHFVLFNWIKFPISRFVGDCVLVTPSIYPKCSKILHRRAFIPSVLLFVAVRLHVFGTLNILWYWSLYYMCAQYSQNTKVWRSFIEFHKHTHSQKSIIGRSLWFLHIHPHKYIAHRKVFKRKILSLMPTTNDSIPSHRHIRTQVYYT